MTTVQFLDEHPAPGHPDTVLMVGIAHDDSGVIERGGRREVVRVATQEDVDTYPDAYQAYVAVAVATAGGSDGFRASRLTERHAGGIGKRRGTTTADNVSAGEQFGDRRQWLRFRVRRPANSARSPKRWASSSKAPCGARPGGRSPTPSGRWRLRSTIPASRSRLRSAGDRRQMIETGRGWASAMAALRAKSRAVLTRGKAGRGDDDRRLSRRGHGGRLAGDQPPQCAGRPP